MIVRMTSCFLACVCLLLNGCVQTPRTEADVFSSITQLTSGYSRAGEAYFSHDMQWVIFQATPTGETQYAMFVARLLKQGDDVTGIGQPIRITPPGTRNTCGYFSPDGVSVIFASTKGKEDPAEASSGYQRQGRDYRWSFPAGMEIFRADGWQAAIAATEFSKGIDLAQHAITDNNAYDAECAFSADGKSIVFASNRDADPATTRPSSADLDLYAMRADGSNPVCLTTTPGYDGGPFFSPDGRRLVYRSDRMNNNLLQIFIADVVRNASGDVVSLANEKQLTRGANVNWGPYWHADGRQIVFSSSAISHTNYELFVIDDQAKHLSRLTFAAGADILPVYSPDGKYLMWTSQRATDKTSQLFIGKLKARFAATAARTR